MESEKIIRENHDVLTMLDELLEEREQQWWDDFYKNRNRKVPFFKDCPDDNLVKLIDSLDEKPKSALDIGCGNGRNSLYLKSHKIKVTGIDISKESIQWASEKNDKNDPTKAEFETVSFFDFKPPVTHYDFIYDSGCLHHIKPHRRPEYLAKIASLLPADGLFALNCFNLMVGANLSDYDVYRNNSMSGGLGYSKEKLTSILEDHFKIISFEQMTSNNNDKTMNLDILWYVIMKRKD
ncbi:MULTISPECIES: class I SAM-dependent methyltransferase [unclassified Fusibacter]|uniref:class I SAM-dependent methyltransferase n=1 Tax=unclassified Fusibacter TaxID=2624464 RepID=UPI001010440E|nr:MULTISPECIES: class I SAM-dependent methyltransferase [unclassified Fusibacter]MCK8058165.1 class I SAM-dependent methyltransferase [Fusibacter sp. A2]NPE20748.1 class I SAM-dependent methyltransferase [Fusibacter sp. A1]RXV62955.1 class I SAM-dependent methyltransferase [Fusibacter sp. A1]